MKNIRYGSVCSGVEAATLAWIPLGWECKFVAEVEPFPCAVLQERLGATAPIHPLDPAEATDEKDRKMREAWKKQNAKLKTEGVLPNEGDFTKIGKKYAGKIDLLVGGTPCQDLSVAGKRAGFDGERSSLALDFVRLAYESQCQWFVWENVPGVFSSNDDRDFATLLSLFSGSKVGVPRDGWSSAGFVCNARRDRYGVAWRVLDGQFTRASGFPFAVPQRRRRVFVVGYFGDWTRAAQVLLEPNRLSWNTPTRFKARQGAAGFAPKNSAMADGSLRGIENQSVDRHRDASGVNISLFASGCHGGYAATSAAGTLKSSGGDIGGGSENFVTFWNGKDVAETLTAKGADDKMPDKNRLPCVIEQKITDNNLICLNDQGGNVICETGVPSTVRRLLPIECERLMGFPDNWTKIPFNGKTADDCPDSPRYKACGNSMCVNVMRWIGEQIDRVDKMEMNNEC